MKFIDLEINTEELLAAARVDWTFGAHNLAVRTYLPIADKADFVKFVLDNSLDAQTGTSSPIRTEIYFALALAKWYADIDITWDKPEDVMAMYDALELSGFNKEICEKIGEDYDVILEMVNETIKGVEKYVNSLAGIIHDMSQDTTTLDAQLKEALEGIKDEKGLELLREIKNVAGSD